MNPGLVSGTGPDSSALHRVIETGDRIACDASLRNGGVEGTRDHARVPSEDGTVQSVDTGRPYTTPTD